MNAPQDRNNIISLYRQGPALLEQAVLGLPDADLDAAPSGGGWTIREIVHHLVDGDDIWKTCIKMALGNEQAEFALEWYWTLGQQETWAESWAYRRRSIDTSLALFKANREHILALLESLPSAWERSVAFRTPDGRMERVSVGFVVELQAGHVLEHTRRIGEILRERGGG